jgi:hypothetical protein
MNTQALRPRLIAHLRMVLACAAIAMGAAILAMQAAKPTPLTLHLISPLPFPQSHTVIADVNGDGRADLVTDVPGNAAITTLQVGLRQFRAVSNPYYRAASPPRNGYQAWSAIGDVTGDGIPDSVQTVVTFTSTPRDAPNGPSRMVRVQVQAGRPGGSFGAPYWARVENRSGHTMPDLSGLGRPVFAIGDVTGDGRADLILEGAPTGGMAAQTNIEVLAAQRDGSFRLTGSFDGADDITSAELADVSGDGAPEVILGRLTGFAQLDGQLRSAPTVVFDPHRGTEVSTSMPPTTTFADINRDGRADAVYAAPDGEIYFRPGNGNDTFGPAQLLYGKHLTHRSRLVVPAHPPEAAEYLVEPPIVAAADVTGDGLIDLVIESRAPGKVPADEGTGPNGIRVLAGDGHGHFHQTGPTLLVNNAALRDVTDLDGDGHPDLIFDADGTEVAWGLGHGQFD